MHITEREKIFAVQLGFRGAMQFVMLFVFTSAGIHLCAQTVTIKIVNGRSGCPMASTYVNVWIGHIRKEAMAIPTDKDGIAWIRLTDNDNEIDIINRGKYCGDFGVTCPVVKYDDSLRGNVGYVLCQPHAPDYSWLALANFSTKQLIDQGIVMPNTCGKATASLKPGELVIFVRPLKFWEKLKE